MFPFRRLPNAVLVELCRTIRNYMGAGLTLHDVFKQQAKKGFPAMRPVAGPIAEELARGEDLETALAAHADRFPPLFISMASVGEQTGTLPEVCAQLEKYFRLQMTLWRTFMMHIIWPVFQLCAGIFVITGMILILGMLAPSGSAPFDPLGLGLTGTTGAMIFLFGSFGLIALSVILFFLLRHLFSRQGTMDALLLCIPAVGPCMRALAMARFCLGLRLTLDTSLPITKAVGLSLRATGNGAFQASQDKMIEGLKRGDELTAVFSQTNLFPEEFLSILAVAEESGRLTEVLAQQAEHYQDEAARRLVILTHVAGWCVWAMVAILIIMVIFRIALTYIGMLDPDHPMYKIG